MIKQLVEDFDLSNVQSEDIDKLLKEADDELEEIIRQEVEYQKGLTLSPKEMAEI